MNLKRKVGPLPLYTWLIIAAGVFGVVIWRQRHSSSSSSSSSTGANAVDPATGLTYGQESAEQAAGIDPLTGQTYASEYGAQGSASSGGGGDSGTGSGGSNSTTPGVTIGQEISDITALITGIQGLEQALNGGGTTPSPAEATTGLTNTTSPAEGTLVGGPVQKNLQPSGSSEYVTTHPGGAFYKYYEKVMGHPPPSLVKVTSSVYQAWKDGVRAADYHTAVANGGKITGGGTGAISHAPATRPTVHKARPTGGASLAPPPAVKVGSPEQKHKTTKRR